MPGLIEYYAIIGNCESAASVGSAGSIDWLAFPRFDSPACFAALLGAPLSRDKLGGRVKFWVKFWVLCRRPPDGPDCFRGDPHDLGSATSAGLVPG